MKIDGRLMKPDREYVMSRIKVDAATGCWIWQGHIDENGYGRLAYCRKDANGKAWVFAHRLVYFVHRGDFDRKLFLCHKCDNPPCCNPDHLFLGTSKDNQLDMVRKGRQGGRQGERQAFSKLKEDDVRLIRKLHGDGMSNEDIRRRHFPHVWCTTIRDVVIRRSWKHVP